MSLQKPWKISDQTDAWCFIAWRIADVSKNWNHIQSRERAFLMNGKSVPKKGVGLGPGIPCDSQNL